MLLAIWHASHDSTPLDLALLATVLAVFVGSLAAGLAGFAFSAVAGAMLFHWLPPIEAVPLLLACSVATQVFSITKLWHVMEWRRCAPYIFGGFAGIPIGTAILELIDRRAFAVGFGIFLTCYSSYMLLRLHVFVKGSSRLIDAFAGFAGGITGGASAFPGAIPVILCNMRGLSKNEQRGIVQAFILIMQLATLTYFSKPC
jgi:uncharacterized membrane protein YfcA